MDNERSDISIENIKKYIADYTNMPITDLTDCTDLVTDIPWHEFHEDERFHVFIDDFIDEFDIYVPEQDFRLFAKLKGIPIILYPVWYIRFLYKLRPQFEIFHLTIDQLHKIAKKGTWSIKESF